ncbi:hypothetical protein LEP1GSC188_4236 [Leptospira weilii serovar Topaz str. LT2116]|uniref:Uncharacterized protein n=1 Tax=Leptospira weilii serovar Topaz str. LT2116 TaxID=1088540 RepID=M3H5H5_9LEPT|nr:hypothetical protein LEP1GSC188_4236 [Leptospira weilii serovar Topaz str. LT2116]
MVFSHFKNRFTKFRFQFFSEKRIIDFLFRTHVENGPSPQKKIQIFPKKHETFIKPCWS